jgi:hypothetical protein
MARRKVLTTCRAKKENPTVAGSSVVAEQSPLLFVKQPVVQVTEHRRQAGEWPVLLTGFHPVGQSTPLALLWQIAGFVHVFRIPESIFQ